MRPRPPPFLRILVPVVAGALVAGALVAGVYLSGSVVLLPAGTSVSVPPFLNGTSSEGGTGVCDVEHDCGRAGDVEIGFRLALAATLTGTLQLSGPVELFLATEAGAGVVECDREFPPSNCTTSGGLSGELFEGGTVSGTVQIGALDFHLDGANNVVPAGSWTLYLVNWGDAAVTATFTGALTAGPG